ncbi:MAG: tRNA 2-thiouridine(34) synthase MnmA, partial [Bacteroidia bacterium]|nr:tRNA 2-thiouridine(34) synthase MnmA [Bacteroidia bacterium]
TMGVRGVNLVKLAAIEDEVQAITKIRYKHEGSKSLIRTVENGDLEVDFLEEVSGVAPGQSAVFYDGNDVIGGGFIKK